MQAILERCAGVDVGQGVLVATVLVGPAHKRPRKDVRSFSTMTADLIEMRDWFLSEAVTHVAMESTGVYWKPIHGLLEDHFEVIVGNATHIKKVPGRKTDVKDSEWLADLARHGLIAKSFVPPRPIRDLRDLTRYRRKLVESRATERNRLLKLLETANIKLSSVATDVFGASGMLMLRALVKGETTPEAMAGLAKGLLRRKIADLALALDGRMEAHHRLLLAAQLRRLDQVESEIADLDQFIDDRVAAYDEQRLRLDQIPGVDRIAAASIIAELGVDMSVFPTVKHVVAWAGVCPGNNESAGKRGSQPIRKGNVHLRTILVEAAQAASRAKGTYLKDKFHRLKARRGYKRALIAVAHKILVAAYHMLSTGGSYADLGDTYLDHLDKRRITSQLVRRLERLGYGVHLNDQQT